MGSGLSSNPDPVCEREHPVGTLSPLCLDGVVTAVLRT